MSHRVFMLVSLIAGGATDVEHLFMCYWPHRLYLLL